MDILDLRNRLAHSLCDYLREGTEEALLALGRLLKDLENRKDSVNDPLTREFIERKVKLYKAFLSQIPDSVPTQGEIDKTVRVAKELFNRRLYFEVHEMLEDVWMGEFGQFREFLQALIQLGAAFYQRENFNQRGYKLLLQNALELLNDYSGLICGINIDLLKQDINRALKDKEYKFLLV